MRDVNGNDTPLAKIVKPASDTMQAEQIANGIFMSEDVSNSYAVATQVGAVVINTGTLTGGPKHFARYRNASLDKMDYIILTQDHVDHVGGLQAFLEDQPKTIADCSFPEGFGYYRRMQPF